ncbi:hypothetical protein QYM36_015172 [Artemia franciscana]|uniref:Integrase catalytic domain-containing protein n=1 Tax=Artemia franciscana TaxID=6661 RepID=A0AA88HL04_ARTSF|nr:hypothetical protein QYM36_015172 [Artemia franciscana]
MSDFLPVLRRNLFSIVVHAGQAAIQSLTLTAVVSLISIAKFSNDIDILTYLNTFWCAAIKNQWDKSTWAVTLRGLLTGKAAEATLMLPLNQTSGYDEAKAKEKSPLISLPIVEEPFYHVARDIVGLLTTSRNGDRLLLVFSDYATRYPEALPLRTTNARKIAEILKQFFCQVGVPFEILTDQGSKFQGRPQDILKEQWEAAPTALRQNRPTVELLQVRPRIEKLMKEAQQNGRQAASQQKKLYGRRKKPCELKRVIYEIEKPEAMKKYKVLPINLLRRFKRRLPENLMTAVDRNLNAFERVNGGDSGVCSGLCESETHLGEKGEEELLSLLQDF